MSGWPVELSGVTETLVTTPGPNGRWNVAALGVHAPENEGPPTARTWGRTRTWRNFRERGEGSVQFTTDPVLFVEAALSVQEVEEPILDEAHAWVRICPERIDSGTDGGTEWVDWALPASQSGIESRVVPTVSRAYGAVVEGTVAASRLDVEGYDSAELRERIDFFESVVERCGGSREQRAFDRLLEIMDD
jgi:hypothetical protein